MALWRSGSDGAQQSNDCWFKLHAHRNLQGELLELSELLEVSLSEGGQMEAGYMRSCQLK